MADVQSIFSQIQEKFVLSTLIRKIPVRIFQYFFYICTVIIFSGIFTSLSVAIVPMTGQTVSAEGVTEHVDWTNPDAILSAFFWASCIPHISGPQLSRIVGAKWLLFFSMAIGSVFNIAILVAADSGGSNGVIVCRVFQGLCHGFMYPALHNLINVWSPVTERSWVSDLVYSGAILGTAICMPLAGILSGSEHGWPAVFYVFGSLGMVWGILFVIFVSPSPDTHNSITEEEKEYIDAKPETTIETTTTKSTPWKSIAKSLPIWAILVAGSAQYWGTFTLQTQIPTYISEFMNFDIAEDGDIAGLPYFVQLAVCFFVVPLTKYLISQKVKDTINRKIFNSLGSFIPAIALIALAFIDSSQKDVAVALLVIAVATSVFAHSGCLINVFDLTPNHAPSVQSMVHSTITIFSILGPLSVGWLGSNKKDPGLWQKVFLIAAAIYIVGGIFYCAFASAEVEAWNFDNGEQFLGAKVKDFLLKWWRRFKRRLSSFRCLEDRKCCCKMPDINWSAIKSKFDCSVPVST